MGVLLFYRGRWRPFCRSQLSDSQKHLDQFQAQNVKVFSLSVDSEANAAQTVTRHSLSFPVAYGLDVADTYERIGAYTSEESDSKPTYVQATGFILTPEGNVALALYSSGRSAGSTQRTRST